MQFEQKIDKLFEGAISKEIFPGASFVFFHNGQRIYKKSFGHLIYGRGAKKVTDDTLFDIASVTKQIVTTAFLKLINCHKISLDNAVTDILDNLEATPLSKVTMRHLLTHTSGINIRLSALSRNELLNLLNETLGGKTNFEPPGKKVTYSNINLFIIGKIIEKVSKETLGTYLNKNVFLPLEMSNTQYNPDKISENNIAPTEKTFDGLLRGVVHDESSRKLGGICGHAGLFSTINDLEHFMSLWINSGIYNGKEFINRCTVQSATTNQTPTLNLSMGLGWRLDDPHYLGNHIPKGTFFHPGFTGSLIGGSIINNFYFIFLSNSIYPFRKDPEIKYDFLRNLFDIFFSVIA